MSRYMATPVTCPEPRAVVPTIMPRLDFGPLVIGLQVDEVVCPGCRCVLGEAGPARELHVIRCGNCGTCCDTTALTQL
jgi:hypothetical protein